MKKLLYLILIAIFCACNHPINQQSEPTSNLHDTLSLLYAEGFDIVQHADYQEIVVYDPWYENQILARYYLVEDDGVITPKNGQKIKVPISNLAATSSTHFEFISLLGELDKIIGVCSPELIYNDVLRKKYDLGELTNLGDAFNINLEKTLQLNPDIVMMSGFKQDDPYAERVMRAGLPVVHNNEWMESSLLARAEWIKFVAAFFNKTHEADSIFLQINEQYIAAKEKAQSVQNKPKILTSSNFRGTWYMPGGQSFMAQLYYDAGADYVYADDSSKGSLPLNVESVLVDFAEVDIWLNCGFDTKEELILADKKHQLFKPVKINQVYNFHKRKLPSGANDYWESAVARPDFLLLDVIAILHPDLLPNHEFKYAKVLE